MKPIGFRPLLRHLQHTILFLLVWSVFLNGCSSWRTLEKPPIQSNPKKVLVTLKDESKVTVFGAYIKEKDVIPTPKKQGLIARADSLLRIESDPKERVATADTLYGYESRLTSRDLMRVRPRQSEVEPIVSPTIAIPLRDISFIEEKYTSAGKTISLVLLGTVVFLGAVAALTCCDGDVKISGGNIPPFVAQELLELGEAK